MSVPSFVKLAPNMDTSLLANALNTNFNQVQSESRRKVVTDESGINRIIIGKLDDGTYGIAYYDIKGNLISKSEGKTTTTYYTTGVVSSTDDGTTNTKYDTAGNILSVDDGNKTVYYDANNPRILIGKAPNDGRIGMWVSKTGVNVVTELGG